MANVRCILISICLTVCWIAVVAQQDTLLMNCTWVGELTQEDGGYVDSYSLTIRFHVNENGRLSGYSSVAAQDTLVADMNFNGDWHEGGYIQLSEYSIEHSDEVSAYEWCKKNYSLYLRRKENTWYLVGFWTGRSSSSICAPGKILLKRRPFQV